MIPSLVLGVRESGREWEKYNTSPRVRSAAAKSLQSCLTLSDLMDCSLPGSSVHGIFQARVLEWGAIAFSAMLGHHCSYPVAIAMWKGRPTVVRAGNRFCSEPSH